MRIAGSPGVRQWRRFVQGRPEELGIDDNGGRPRGGRRRRRRWRRIVAPHVDSFGEEHEDGTAELRGVSPMVEVAGNGGNRRRPRVWVSVREEKRERERASASTGERGDGRARSLGAYPLTTATATARILTGDRRRARGHGAGSSWRKTTTFFENPLGFPRIAPQPLGSVTVQEFLLRTPWFF